MSSSSDTKTFTQFWKATNGTASPESIWSAAWKACKQSNGGPPYCVHCGQSYQWMDALGFWACGGCSAMPRPKLDDAYPMPLKPATTPQVDPEPAAVESAKSKELEHFKAKVREIAADWFNNKLNSRQIGEKWGTCEWDRALVKLCDES